MPDGREELTLRSVGGVGALAPGDWDACAGADNPFVSHAFFQALEESGAASPRTGWTPCHLAVEDGAGRALGVAPLYAKTHSFGEYVFDWGWAEAWSRVGGRYYPKLQCAVPFTPVPGPRLLVRPEARSTGVGALLARGIAHLAAEMEWSSAHITFCTREEAELFAAQGWLTRLGEQYHWHNRGYRSFEDFLETLSSRKRKAIRKERERANGHGLAIRTLTGGEIRARHWDAFHRFYLDTVERKCAEAYLPREFFHRLGAELGERVVLMVAEDGARMVAGALNLLGGDALFGRNWGAAVDLPFLHFEMCYYRALDYAIARGLARVEAGAQGEHKISRGYLPVSTYSAHWIREAPLRDAIADFLLRERDLVAADIAERQRLGPYRQVD
ncbi:conserved hypothetical protein [uncultured Alphaproteobacteria bacterium]|uniref:GNAT family N-acetyltransferase n=1 Tax=uncultured Alphaproteobacteria bacterium TaxID=91750 RepID=A0A212IWS3_9PROT|nr:conserved hypothetical protein [uncultured Alphaproteobacteria bacterium]